MTYLALDLSKTSTGYALWKQGMDRPLSGAWQVGSEYTSPGRAFCNLHQRLNDLYQIEPFEVVAFEEPLGLGPAMGHSNPETILLLVGLAAHVHSFCAAKAVLRCSAVHMATWRRHFLGRMPRATKSAQLKDMARARCREFGFEPRSSDEAEAIGILDWLLDREGERPAWVEQNVLRAPLARRA